MSVKTGLDQSHVVDAAEYILKDTANAIWLATDLQNLLDNIVRELSKRVPKKKRTALLVIDGTKNIDISGLTGMKKILSLEYPSGYNPPNLRNWREHDDAVDLVEIDIDYEPTVTTGTLTGTVTFTQNDNGVSGSGTLFLTEMSKNMFIAKSGTTKYYRVIEVVSNTHLHLEVPFEETTGADTVNITKYADAASICYLYWGGEYSIAASASDIPSKYDQILITGLVALAAQQYLNSQITGRITACVAKIGTANTTVGTATARLAQAATDLASARTALGNIAARITQALTDIGTNRTAVGLVAARLTQAATDLGTHRTNVIAALSAFDTAIADVAARINAAIVDLTTGAPYITTVNHGEKVPENYADFAKTELENAKAYLDKALAYVDKSKSSTDYISIAEQEIAGGVGKVREGEGSIAAAEGELKICQNYVEQALDYIKIAAGEAETAKGYMDQAKSYVAIIEQEVNVVYLINSFKSFATTFMNQYTEMLEGIPEYVDDDIGPGWLPKGYA
jgi:hypothetical protein